MYEPSTKPRGFTLIEVVLVAVILAIVWAIVGPCFCTSGEKARINAAKADMSAIGTQLQTFKNSNGRVPTTTEGLQELVTDSGNLPNWSKLLDRVPADPWKHPYRYLSPGTNGRDFDLYSTGPSGRDGNADNIRSN